MANLAVGTYRNLRIRGALASVARNTFCFQNIAILLGRRLQFYIDQPRYNPRRRIRQKVRIGLCMWIPVEPNFTSSLPYFSIGNIRPMASSRHATGNTLLLHFVVGIHRNMIVAESYDPLNDEQSNRKLSGEATYHGEVSWVKNRWTSTTDGGMLMAVALGGSTWYR